MGADRSLYDVLGVPHHAGAEEIRTAFLRLVRHLHPDANPAAGPGETHRLHLALSEVNEAWRVLGDVDRRDAYDAASGHRRGSIDAIAWPDRPEPPPGFTLCAQPSLFSPDGRPFLRFADDVFRALSLRASTDDLSALGSGRPPVWRLDASGRRIGDDQLVHLRAHRGLRELDLSWTPVTDAGVEHLAVLAQLLDLDLWATSVTDSGLAHIGRLASLQALRLGMTRVTDDGLAHLGGLSSLVTLDLRGTRVRGPGLAALARLRRLEHVVLPVRVRRRWRTLLKDAVPGVNVS